MDWTLGVRTRVGGLLAALLFAALLHASSARACTSRGCIEGALLPEDLSYTPGLDLDPERPGEVPENNLAIVWRKPLQWTRKESNQPPHLFIREDRGQRELPFSMNPLPDNPVPPDGTQLFAIEPDEAVSAGSELVFEWQETCSDSESGEPATESRSVRVVPAAPVPRELGKLVAGEVRRGWIDLGSASVSCSDSIDAAYMDFSLKLSSEAEPYRDQFRFELRVDGKPQPFYDYSTGSDARRPIGGGVMGRSRDRVWDRCEGGSGEHRVQLRASLPDGTELATPEAHVDLTCGGCSLTPAAAGGSPFWLGALCSIGLVLCYRRRSSHRSPATARCMISASRPMRRSSSAGTGASDELAGGSRSGVRTIAACGSSIPGQRSVMLLSCTRSTKPRLY